MRSFLIIYEDKYGTELHNLLKRVRRDDLAIQAVLIQQPQTARGTGGFVKEVRHFINLRLPRGAEPASPVDLVICVADGDRPQNLVPGFRAAPSSGDPSVGGWLEDLEAQWLAKLVKNARLTPDEERRVQTRCLRWCKESLIIAAVDVVREHIDQDRLAAVDAYLGQCSPNPRLWASQPAASFTDHYRDPQKCLKRIFLHGKPPESGYNKGSDGDDLLKKIAGNAEIRRLVRERCPDLDRLASILK